MNRRRVAWCFAVAVAAASTGLLVHRRKARNVQHWDSWQAICNFIAAFKQVSDVAVDVSHGAHEYITGQSADIPHSLMRSLELASSQPVARAIRRLAGQDGASPPRPGILDTVLQAAMTERGQNLLALVVSVSTTRFMAALTATYEPSAPGSPTFLARLISWSETPGGHALIVRVVNEFVATGTAVYCTQTADMNPYDLMLKAAAKPEHLVVLKSLTSAFCYATVHAIKSSPPVRADVQQMSPKPRNGTLTKLHAPPALPLEPSTLRNGRLTRTCSEPHRAVNGVAHTSSSQAQLPAMLLAACESDGVRQMCAGIAREGCAGAVQAGCEHLAGSEFARGLASQRTQRVLLMGVVLWSLLLPLFVLYVMTSVLIVP